jgi:hypothetical protein
MNSSLPQDLQIWLVGLSIVSGLFLLSLFRLFLLSRSNRRLRAVSARMEKQTALQQMEVTGIHHEAMSWRAKTQRQFEALRSDFSHRLQQSDQGGLHALREGDAAQKKALAAAHAHISELEAALSTKRAAAAAEAQRSRSLESELAAARAEITSGRQQNVVLQRDLLLTRRRLSAPAVRKSPLRGMVRSA